MKSKRRIATSFFSLIAIALFASLQYNKADAQRAGDITLAAHAGFDGYCVQNQWNPARITVENNGTDVNARAQIEYSEYGRKVQYGAELSLPRGSRKEVTVYFYPQSPPSDLAVSLIAEGEQALAQSPLRIECLADDTILYGVLSDNPLAFNSLKGIYIGGKRIALARINIDDLPTDARGWGALDTLIVHDTDTGELSSEQRDALDSWLADGGKLIVVGGVHWQGTVAGIQDLLPVSFIRAVQVNSLSAISAFVPNSSPLETSATVAVGSLRAESESTIEQDGYSLASIRKVANGAVIYLAIDPELQPFSKWNGLEAFYIRLFDLPTPQDPWVNGMWDQDTPNLLSTLKDTWSPSPLTIYGIIALYVLTVSPINYILLKRLKKLDFGWLSILTITISFAILFYFAGIPRQERDPVINRFTLVETDMGSSVSKVNALISVSSSHEGTYEIQMGDNIFGRPLTPIEGEPISDWTSVRQGDKFTVTNLFVGAEGMTSIAAQGKSPAPPIDGETVVEIYEKDVFLTVRVLNRGSTPIKDALLIAPGLTVKLGDIPPATPSAWAIKLNSKYSSTSFRSLLVFSLPKFHMNFPRNSDEELYHRYILLNSLFGNDNGVNAGKWSVYILGWTNAPALPMKFSADDYKVSDTALYTFRISPEIVYKSDIIALPPQLMSWETSKRIPLNMSLDVPTEGIHIRFMPGFPFEFARVISLTAHFRSRFPDKVAVSLWDFAAGDWVQLPRFTQRDLEVPNAARFVAPNGEVRMKLDRRYPILNAEVRVANITLVVER